MTLLRVNDVAALMSVSPMTIYRMIHAGEIPAVKIGRSYRIEHRAVEAYLQLRGVGPRSIS